MILFKLLVPSLILVLAINAKEVENKSSKDLDEATTTLDSITTIETSTGKIESDDENGVVFDELTTIPPAEEKLIENNFIKTRIGFDNEIEETKSQLNPIVEEDDDLNKSNNILDEDDIFGVSFDIPSTLESQSQINDTKIVFDQLTSSNFPNEQTSINLQKINTNQPTNTATEQGIRFHLYSNESDLDECYSIEIENKESLKKSGYNASLPLKVLIHSFFGNSRTFSDVRLIKDAYLRAKTKSNIIMVDYGLLIGVTSSSSPNPLAPFTLALSFFRLSSIINQIRNFLQFLINCQVLNDSKDIHLIGYGIGSHIAGSVGLQFQQQSTNGKDATIQRKIGRITGINPTIKFPFTRKFQLNPSDSSFVDVIVTNWDPSRFNIFRQRRGHSIFYVNGGGPFQPNCPRLIGADGIGCSNRAGIFYFSKSIEKPGSIVACQCVLRRCFGPSKIFANLFRTSNCLNPVEFGEFTAKTNVQRDYYVHILT